MVHCDTSQSLAGRETRSFVIFRLATLSFWRIMPKNVNQEESGWSSLRRRHGIPRPCAAESEIPMRSMTVKRDARNITQAVTSKHKHLGGVCVFRSVPILHMEVIIPDMNEVVDKGKEGARWARSVANETRSRAGVTGRAAARPTREDAAIPHGGATLRTQSVPVAPSCETRPSPASHASRDGE